MDLVLDRRANYWSRMDSHISQRRQDVQVIDRALAVEQASRARESKDFSQRAPNKPMRVFHRPRPDRRSHPHFKKPEEVGRLDGVERHVTEVLNQLQPQVDGRTGVLATRILALVFAILLGNGPGYTPMGHGSSGEGSPSPRLRFRTRRAPSISTSANLRTSWGQCGSMRFTGAPICSH